MRKIFYTIALLCFSIVSCSNEDEVVPNPDNEPLPRLEIANLREAPVVFGGAVSINEFRNGGSYTELLKQEFAGMTPENALKMEALSTRRNEYNFTDADELVAFAQANGMRVHGHTLVWYRAIPWWLQQFQGSKEEWKGILKDYITTVVTHFKGKVASWDVVNEAFTDQGELRTENNVWYQNIGEEYIELAFRYAHEADPDALLFYNDYGQEYSTAKAHAIAAKMQELKEADVPIDGVGFQMHINLTTNEQFVRYGLRSIADLGMLVHISELDVALNNTEKDADLAFSDELAEQQQEKYRNTVRAYMEVVPEAQRYGITTWGIYDGASWLNSENGIDYPLLFDRQFQRKPAYTGILEGLYTSPEKE